MSDIPWKPKYEWRITWPGEREKDWIAIHDRLEIGRVRLDRTSLKSGMYHWSGNCSCWWGFKRPMPQVGHEVEAWQAAKAVEDWYDDGCAKSGPRPALVAGVIQDLEWRQANWPIRTSDPPGTLSD